MKNKRYWLRFGVIFLIVYVLICTIFYILVTHCNHGYCFEYLVPLVVLAFPAGIFVDMLHLNVSGDASLAVTYAINAVIWFLIWSIIGFLYGKFKKNSMVQ